MRVCVLLLSLWAVAIHSASAVEPEVTIEQDWLARQIDVFYQRTRQHHFEPVIDAYHPLDIAAASLEPQSLRLMAEMRAECLVNVPSRTGPLAEALETGRFYHFYFPNRAELTFTPLADMQAYYQTEPRRYGARGRLIGYAVPARQAAAEQLDQRSDSYRSSPFRLPDESFGLRW